MRGQGKLIAGMVVGAGAMYILDPDRGARRRSLLRDQGVHAGHRLADGLAATARDARNRTAGVAAELRSRFRTDQAEDEVVHDRVRSAVGRVVSHPRAIALTVSEGRVTLTGHVLADEVDALTDRVQRVRGVNEVRNELEIHRDSEGVSALQGGEQPRAERPELLQANWSPAIRLVFGATGALLALKGVRTKSPTGRALRVLGLGLLARSATNLPARRLVRLGGGQQSILIEKTISVAAPVEQVWEVWSNFEAFPRFMSHLREVRKIDQGRSHWVAIGPGGLPVEWDAIVTDWVPNRFIGWRSVEGSTIETSGRVRFRPRGDGNTEIDVQLSYSPPAGAIGHSVATLLGADPKRSIDEDMVRIKSLLEGGETRPNEEPIGNEVLAQVSEKRSPKNSGSKRQRPKS